MDFSHGAEAARSRALLAGQNQALQLAIAGAPLREVLVHKAESQSSKLQGDVDKDFIRMMRQHHLQGIEMARIQLEKGDDAEARRMAQKILDEQQKDVQEMSSWLQRHQ